MPLDFLYIAVFIAAFCSIWVTELTKLDGGLLWKLPKLYPYPETFLGKVLRCSICLSGWLCLMVNIAYAAFFGGWWHIIPFMFISMSIAKIISNANN